MTLTKARFIALLCVSSVVLLPAAVVAQADKSQLATCYAIKDINTRVACYDALARPAEEQASAVQSAAPANAPAPTARSAAPVVAAPVAPSAAPATAASAASKVETFGQQPARIEADASGTEALLDSIAAIRESEPGKWQITLANGQVWKQDIAKTFLLRKDDKVRITPNPWGDSFRLEKDGKPGYIQVKRLR